MSLIHDIVRIACILLELSRRQRVLLQQAVDSKFDPNGVDVFLDLQKNMSEEVSRFQGRNIFDLEKSGEYLTWQEREALRIKRARSEEMWSFEPPFHPCEVLNEGGLNYVAIPSEAREKLGFSSSNQA